MNQERGSIRQAQIPESDIQRLLIPLGGNLTVDQVLATPKCEEAILADLNHAKAAATEQVKMALSRSVGPVVARISLYAARIYPEAIGWNNED